MRYNTPRTLGAGNGFAIAVTNGRLQGFNIEVPAVDNVVAVAAGCVAVVALTDGLCAWVRRPSKNGVLEAICAKVNDLALGMFSVVSISVSDRAVGFTAFDRYGLRLFVVGVNSLPQDATVADIVTFSGDGVLDGTQEKWHVGVKSPSYFQVARDPIVVSDRWVHTVGWKAIFSHFNPDVEGELEWVEDGSPNAISVHGKYAMGVEDGYAYFEGGDGLPYQVRNMPLRHDWIDVEIGHQCGVGLTGDGKVHFWGTQPL